LGGFDERLAKGNYFDDDEFLFRMKRIGLRLEIIHDCIAVHQWHYSKPSSDPRAGEKYMRHNLLYELVTARGLPYSFFLIKYLRFLLVWRTVQLLKATPFIYSTYKHLEKKDKTG
jgi:GT2 family glycosyltransferase